MPEVHFRVRWPDGGVETCYSPSTVIREFFVAGQSYALDEFLRRSRVGLTTASERVRERYGMACSRALGQLAAIEAKAKAQASEAALVHVEAIT